MATQAKPKFDKRKLQSVELSTFFHPAFLEGCGFLPCGDNSAYRGYLLLRNAIFFRSEEDADGLWSLVEEVYRERKDETETAKEAWVRRAREYCEQHAINTVGDLLEAGGVHGARRVYSFSHNGRPALANVGTQGIPRVLEVMHYFGYKSFAHKNKPIVDVETEKALEAVKFVLKP